MIILLRGGIKIIIIEYPNPTKDAQIYLDALESFAYRILHYEHPTWHSIPEEDVIELLRGEGIIAYVEEN